MTYDTKRPDVNPTDYKI